MNKVDVKFGFLCNNRCHFCVQGNKREQYGDIATEDIVKTLETARQDSGAIVFTGGEVTIKKDFIYLVGVAKKLDYHQIQIQTNGRMFANEKFCTETIAAGANDFSLALHGDSAALHDYLTQVPGSFAQTARGIRNLRKLGQHVSTNSVITRSNYRNLPGLAGLLVYLDVNQFQFAFVHALGSAAENFKRIVPRYPLVEPYVKAGLQVGINAGKVVMTEAVPYCFMSGYEQFVAEKIIPQTKIFDVKVMDDYTNYRITEGKAKGERCVQCLHNEYCEGPWKEYPGHFGWKEFKPVL